MSDELDKLQRELERATASECPSDVPLDTEAAALRRGWLALGKLLESAELESRSTADWWVVLPALSPPEFTSLADRAQRRATTVAALAASLLIGVALLWSTLGSGTQQIALPDAGRDSHQPAVADDELDWDDSLDEQIAHVGQQVIQIQDDWYGLDGAFASVHSGLLQVQEEIEDDTL